jgi:hypothetical protein
MEFWGRTRYTRHRWTDYLITMFWVGFGWVGGCGWGLFGRGLYLPSLRGSAREILGNRTTLSLLIAYMQARQKETQSTR